MNLNEWAISYIKHRDIFQKKIAEIKQEGTFLKISNKDGTKQEILVDEQLAVAADGAIVPNTHNNLQILLTHWKEFVAKEGYRIVFCNPRLNEKWVIIPSHHARIAEEESLKLGLEAMFSEVTEA